MRFIKNIKFLFAAAIALLPYSCTKQEELHGVDLRYNPEDLYVFSAKPGTTQYTFQVKSTDDWVVFGTQDWCIIDPDHGSAGDIYDVNIQCKENDSLDDRLDTITVKSNYWVGTQFCVLQKGTAFFKIGDSEGKHEIVIPKEGGKVVLEVQSNQDWSVNKSEELPDWISIDKVSGKDNDKITIETKGKNDGEIRKARISFLDRHNEYIEGQDVTIIQEGVVLEPDKSYSRVKPEGESISFAISSNADWVVRKENVNDTWYEFEKTEFSGDANLTLIVSKNSSSLFREAKFTIESKKVPGVQPVQKTIMIKQGYRQIKHYSFTSDMWWGEEVVFGEDGSVTISGDHTLGMTDAGLGTWTFYVSDIVTNNMSIRLLFELNNPWTQISYGLWTNNSTETWTNMNINGSNEHGLIPNNTLLTVKNEYTLSMKIEPLDKDSLYLEWTVDGQKLGSYVFKGEDWGKPDLTQVKWLNIQATNAGSSVTFKGWDFEPMLDWNDSDLLK